MLFRNWIVISALSCMVGLGTEALASDYHSPRTAGLAGAGHAAPLQNDALYMGPAFGSFLQSYTAAFGFNSFNGKEDAEPKGRVYHLSVVDGRSEIFQAGVGYVHRPDDKLVHVGASKAFLEMFGVGLGTKYGFGSALKRNVKDVSLSIAAVPLPMVQASFMADNILESDIGRQDWNFYREYTLGMKVNLQSQLMLYFDPHLTPGKPGSNYGWELGAEVTLTKDLFFRIGKSSNSMQPHIERYGRGYGWGFGWVGPRITLDLAVARTVVPTRTDQFLFGATVVF